MRLLLDTVVFIWAMNSPERISKKAMSALQDGSAVREFSSVSISEIAIKEAKGKLNLCKDDIQLAAEDLKLRFLPYTADHALALLGLPLHHRDPFDRQLIAQATFEGIPIVTADEKFKLYKGLKVVW